MRPDRRPTLFMPPLLAALGLTFALTPPAHADTLGDVFVIALENHNFTQPSSYTTFKQLQGNSAAPFLNSLITPGNANAANVSYATHYTNAGTGEHPSEPNYIWSEAGTNYNPATNATILGDSDPSTSAKNIFTTPHLTGLMNTAGVSWKTYQEDYQISGQGPGVSASGTLPGGATNPYNGSTTYSYGAKHDPMAFFSDTAGHNTSPLSALATDLTNNTVAQYNWITPNLYNDMHTGLSAGFTYHGTHYTGDQAGVAQGDNFLSIIVPQIEASAAFKNNGAIVIWNDETEGGDSTSFTSTEIVISPLAKGNAYASAVSLNHSSDIKTMQEIFHLGPNFLNNAIPSSEYSPATGPGTYNTVAASNDLADLFQPGVIPALAQPGDANADGTIDLNDLNTVLNNLGQTTPKWTDGNFDHAPTINLNDLNAVLNNLGTTYATNPTVLEAQSLVAAATPAPEPSTLLLSTISAIVFGRRRPRPVR